MSDFVTIKGTAYWPYTQEVNPESEKYCIDVCQLSPETIKELEALNVALRVDPEDSTTEGARGTFLTCKSNAEFKPKVVDKFGKPLDKRIGHGSQVVVRVKLFEWADKFKKKAIAKGEGYVSAGLRTIVVTELVEAESKEDEWMSDIIEQPTPEQIAEQAFDLDEYDD